MQQDLNICLAYESAKRWTAQALSQQKGLATGMEFVHQRLPNPSEYEATLQELEGLRAQLFSSREDGATAGTPTTIPIKVSTASSSHIDINLYTFI